MSRIRWTIEADVDEEALRSHVDKYGDSRYPIVADPSEFDWVDLEAAIGECIVEDVTLVDFEILSAREA